MPLSEKARIALDEEAIRRGLEAVAQGRTRPMSEFLADQRAKHGFPESWPFGTEYDPAHGA